MTTTYSSGKQQLTFTSGNVSVVNGSGNLAVTGTYYLSIQGRNLVGLNINSDLVAVTLTTTSTLTITLPTLESGETWKQIIISASTTNDASTLTQLIAIDNADFGSPVVLDTSEIFKLTTLERTVANAASLPSSPVHGLIRYVTSLNYYYEYDQYSTATVDNLTVLNATTGRWIRVGSISTYITDTTDVDGCDQDVRTPNLSVNAPTYSCDGSKGSGVIFWLRNETSTIIPSGTRVSCTVRLFEEDKSQLFDSLIILELLGYVDLTTGELNTAMSSGEVIYKPRQQWLTLPEDLSIGFAAVVQVSPKFTVNDLDNNVPYLANLSTYITFAPTSGIYTPGVFGNLIYDEYDKWRIYPGDGLSVIKSKGSGIIDKQELNALSSETINSLDSNTANQYIFLTSNGTSFASTTSSFISAVKRCVVSTVDGIGTPISYGTVNLDNTKQLQVTVTYPTNIRANYPDTLIAGSNKGVFNADSVVIYIKNSSNDVFVTEQIITPSNSSDIYTVNYSAFASSTLAAPATNYGLFTPLSVTPITTTIASTFPTDSYEVFVAFKYDEVVTVIDHSVSELYEITVDLQQLFETKATVWLSGNGVPDNGDGENGSYYLNYDNADIYIKVNDTWVLDGNIEVTTPSFGTIVVSGQDDIVAVTSNDTFTLVEGTGITLTTDSLTKEITITGTSVSNTFSTIAVAGQSDIVADSGTDTLTLVAGTGMTITTDAITDTITLESSGINVDVTRTSTTSNTIGTGTKTFTYTSSSNLGWLVGTRLRAANDASNYVEGVITAVSSSSVTITSDNAIGSGTFTSWNITIAGDKGIDGINGDDGVDGVSSYTYIAYADDASGTGFTNTFDNSKDFIAIKTTSSPIVSPIASDFTGLWKNYKGATGATGSVSSATDLTLTEVGSSPTTGANEIKLYNLNNEPTIRLESNGSTETITRYNNDIFKYQLMYG